jgi:hypothetical protein
MMGPLSEVSFYPGAMKIRSAFIVSACIGVLEIADLLSPD